MFWFYRNKIVILFKNKTFQYISCFGSIPSYAFAVSLCFLFQYISCFGSMEIPQQGLAMWQDFNTSHVLVLYSCSACPTLPYIISIHLMFWFYIRESIKASCVLQFQYISCFGSIKEEYLNGEWYSKFQYISCFGSIDMKPRTNDVLFRFQYISCFGSILLVHLHRLVFVISIHLMFWFY